jgi:hypothetical protein
MRNQASVAFFQCREYLGAILTELNNLWKKYVSYFSCFGMVFENLKFSLFLFSFMNSQKNDFLNILDCIE